MRPRRLLPRYAIGLVIASTAASGCELLVSNDERHLRDVAGTGDGGNLDGSIEVSLADAADGALVLSTSVEVLATGQANPRGLALDDRSLYWANEADGTVGTCDKSGGGGARTFGSGWTNPRWVALDPTQVFWTSDANGGCVPGVLKRGKTAAPDAGPQTVASCTDILDHPNGFAVDGSFVYWTTHIAGSGLFAVPKEGGGILTLAATPGGQPGMLALTADAAYWINAPSETVVRYDKGSAAVTVLGAGIKGLTAIAAETNYVYFATITNVLRLPPSALAEAGTAPETVATGQDGPVSLALFGDYVYWGNAGNGAIMRAPKAGGAAAETIASGQLGVRSIAVDASGVYFTRDTGEISRLAFH